MALSTPLQRRRGATVAAVAALLLLVLLGVAAGAAQSAGSGDALPTVEVTITPNWLSPSDSPASNYQAVWVYPTSPSTPYRSPDSRRQVQRYLLLDPRFRDSEGRPGHDEWWFLIERYWPSSYQAATHGKWGREVNFHNVAGDAGPNGGVGWGFGNGSSALALDWLPSRTGPTVTVEPQADARDMALPVPTRDRWHAYLVHFVAGRTDGMTPRAGAITVWVDGADQPAIRRTGINTVQRALAPDGQRYTQRWMQLWEGDYTSGLQVPATTRLVLTRIGRTLAEALADRPVVAGTNVGGQYYSGSGANSGPPSARLISPRAAGEALIPPSLGGGPPAADGAPPSAVPGAWAISTTATSIRLGWYAAVDDVGVIGYEFLRNGSVAGTTPAGSGFTFTGLTCGTAYSLGVRAYDGVGNRGPAAFLGASTGSC